MSSINSISVDKLARLVGTPKCPALIDVRTDEDFAADPRLIPGSLCRRYAAVPDWAREFAGRSVIVTLPAAASSSARASPPGCAMAASRPTRWRAAARPGSRRTCRWCRQAKLPPRDAQGRTVWVTRARPKIDRIACPWLIRRFVDPAAVFLFVAPAEVDGVGERFARHAVRHRGRVLEPSRRDAAPST